MSEIAPADVDLAAVDPEAVATAAGPARVWTFPAADGPPGGTADRRGLGVLVLTHGAGGGVNAGDVRAAAGVARAAGYVVCLVDQPYRVAGRRLPPRGLAADEAWTELVGVLRARHPGGTLVTGGRSFGSRVACRSSAATGSDAVLALAFPTVPGGRAEKTRLPELLAVTVPTLVVVGERDPFGRPDPDALPAHIGLRVVPGDHSLSRTASLAAVRDEVRAWLEGLG